MKCVSCKKDKPEEEYGRKKNGDYNKTCKDCINKYKCQHGRSKQACKDCKGVSICQHERQRSRCKECKGGSICSHNKRKNECRECHGSVFCEHDKRRNVCRECNGGSICSHGKRRSLCRECKGSAFCLHGRQKQNCLECKGSSICIHNNRRNQCKQCNGTSICIHEKQRSTCITCTPSRACQNCKYSYVKPQSKYRPYCFHCFCVLNPHVEIPRKYKIREHHVRDAVKEAFPDTKMYFDKIVDGGCSKRRPDILIDKLTHSIIIECDEDQHKSYKDGKICENRRSMELFEDLGRRPIVFVRFNPDSYVSSEEEKIPGCFKDTKTAGLSLNKNEFKRRVDTLLSIVSKHQETIPEKEVTVYNLFYDGYD